MINRKQINKVRKIKLKNKMKLKTIIIIVSSLILFSGSIHAQGIYSKKTDNYNSSTIDKSNPNSRGLYKAGFGPDDGGSSQGGGGNPSDPGKEPTPDPIGEGIVILSLLTGSYAILKKRKIKQEVCMQRVH
jgi:hypothetical protein